MSRVFISHSSRDSVQALALKAWLEEAEPGLVDEIFVDLDRETGIPAGVRWKEALRKANERCEAVICLLSPNWDSSHECMAEYRTAEDRGKPIFPVRLQPSTGRDITGEWQRCDLFGEGPRTTITVDGHAEPVEFLTEGLARLHRGLRAAGIAPDTFSWPPDGDPDRAPYRGWQPLEAVDAAVYFGRDAEINRALTVVREMRSARHNHAFVILGPSGVGKSSFLRAGLLPRLLRDDRHFMVMDIVRPQRNPLNGQHGLANSIHALRRSMGLNQPGLGGIKTGVADPVMVRQWLIEAQRAAVERFGDDPEMPEPTLVLPVDQAEEVFGVDDAEEPHGFLTALAALLRDGQPALGLVVVATIRSDRYEPLQTAPELAGVDARVFDDLKPMPPDRYREVICGPAERAQRAGGRVQWAPDLVRQLLADCAAGADALPLLALTLSRLYEDYGDGEISLAEYDAMGGMRHIVESEIDAILSADAKTRQDELEKLRSAFIPWLATINPANDQPLRRASRWFDLPPESHCLLEKLVARRLLVLDERNGEMVIEVALESLLRQWETLSDWLRAETADLKNTDAVEQAAQAWENNDRHNDWLLEGARLAEAEALAAKPGFRDRLNPCREYLLSSRQREDQRAKERQDAAEALASAEAQAKVEAQEHARVLLTRTRMLRVALAVVIVVAVAAVFGFGWALKARSDARARFLDATAHRLYAQSQLMLAGLEPGGSDDVLAMQELLAAREIPSTQRDADYRLLAALEQERNLIKVVDVPAQVLSVAVSPDGKRIATGSEDNTVRIWDGATAKPIGEPLRGHDKRVLQVRFSPDGSRLASSSQDMTVRLWDAASGQPVGQPIRGLIVAFSPDSTRIATNGPNYSIQLWDVRSGQPVGQLCCHDDVVLSAAFSPDGKRVASASADKTVRLWDIGTSLPIGEPLRGHDNWATTVAFSPDGAYLASASLDGTVRLWDGSTGRSSGEPLREGNAVVSVSWSPTGARLASAGAGNTIRLWDMATRREVGILGSHRSTVESIAFSPDGRLVSGGEDKTMRIWDAGTWQPMVGHSDKVGGAKFSDDGRRIMSGSDDKTVRWWDAVTGLPVGSPQRVGDDDVKFLYPIDENRLLSFGAVNTVRLWDAHTRMPIGEPLRLPYDPNRYVTYNDKLNRVVAQLDLGLLQIYDAATMLPVGAPIKLQAAAMSLEFTRDGRTLATGDFNGTLQLWDMVTGLPIGQPMPGKSWATSMSFSRDGHLLAAGYQDNTLQLWDTQNFHSVGQPMRLDSTATSLAFSPDGRHLVSGSADGTIRLWNAGDQTQFGPPLIGHGQSVTSLDFSPDGHRFVSASADQTLRMWPMPAPSADALCAKLTHNMSRDEWNRVVSSEIDYREVCPGLPIAGSAG